MRRCWGYTRNFRRCGRFGEWKLFCDDHRLQPIGWSIFFIFTVAAGSASIYSAFPHPGNGPLRPKLHLTRFELIRQNETAAPGINVFFRIEGAGAKVSDGLSRLVVTTFPGDEKEVAREDSLFDGMLKLPTADHTMGETPADKELYVTLVGGPLTDEVWKKIYDKVAAIYFMGRFKYSDGRGEYHSDYCGFFMGSPPPQFLCHHHNEEP